MVILIHEMKAKIEVQKQEWMLPGKHKRNLYFYQMSWSTYFKVLSLILLRFIDIIHENTFLLKLKNLFFTPKLLRKQRWKVRLIYIHNLLAPSVLPRPQDIPYRKDMCFSASKIELQSKAIFSTQMLLNEVFES